MSKIKKKISLEHQKNYFSGLDYLRVFFALAIVAWHTQALGSISLISKNFTVSWRDIIYWNIFLLAVPIFFQISIFLYLYNRIFKPHYFLKRIIYLVILFVFWMTVGLVILFNKLPLDYVLTWRYLISGGYSHLFFLFSLIFLVILSEILLQYKKYLQPKHFLIIIWALLFVSILVIVFKIPIYLHLSERYQKYFIPFWNPLDFSPYVFSSFIILSFWEHFKQKKTQLKEKWPFTLGFLVILAIIIGEWKLLTSSQFLTYNNNLLPPYARLSIILSTFLIFVLFLFNNFRQNRLVTIFAELTLGIYLVHFFILHILIIHLPEFYESQKNSFFLFLLVLSSSIVTSYLIKGKKII